MNVLDSIWEISAEATGPAGVIRAIKLGDHLVPMTPQNGRGFEQTTSVGRNVVGLDHDHPTRQKAPPLYIRAAAVSGPGPPAFPRPPARE